MSPKKKDKGEIIYNPVFYNSDMFESIRGVKIDGKTWFVYFDVIKALKYGYEKEYSNKIIFQFVPQEHRRRIRIKNKNKTKTVFVLDMLGVKALIDNNKKTKRRRRFLSWIKYSICFSEKANKTNVYKNSFISTEKVNDKISALAVCLNKKNKNFNKRYTEGKVRQVTMTRRERNPKNRKACLSFYGHSCQVCGFDFEEVYGEIGKDYILVHHIEMISAFEEEKEIDPIKDLIPVCPNCHSMLHKEDPPMHPDILKQIIVSKKQTFIQSA